MTPSEEIAKKQLEEEGWTVLNDGWPDFLAFRPDGTVRFIEVKGDKDSVRFNQQKVHDVLRSLGLNVEVMQFGEPGRPAVRVRKGKCPHCGEIVCVRKDGRAYAHVGERCPGQDKMICPDEPFNDSDDDSYEKSMKYPVTEFID